MSNKLMENAKYKKWLGTHTFENCVLDRGDYGRFLADYITGEYDGFVLNINGSWGTGKTEFLKRFYCELLKRGHPVIYIDAWESDFSNDPLTVVASELVDQLEKLNENLGEDFEKVKGFLGNALKATLIGAAGFAAKTIIDDGTTGVEIAKQLLNVPSKDLCESLAKGHVEQVASIHKIKTLLSSTAETLNTNLSCNIPVVVLIDELDRCRPTYSIEMLEVVKHFFNTKNFVFVVASDTVQLSHSIKSVYGDDFDSKQYLKRFFDRKANLLEPDIDQYICALNKNYEDVKGLEFVPYYSSEPLSKNDVFNVALSNVSFAYDLKLRDIDQLIAKVDSCVRNIVRSLDSELLDAVYVNIVALAVALVEQDKEIDSFNIRSKFNHVESKIINSKTLIDGLNLSEYISFSLKHTVLLKVKSDRSFREDYIERLPLEREIKGNYDNGGMEFRRFSKSLSSVNGMLVEGSRKKYLLWDEIKRVVALAGYLE